MQPLQETRDEELMKALQEGDHDALALLFDRYYRLILSVALKILRSPAEAEDVMQEVFLEIFTKAKQFDPVKGSVTTWLLQYAYHRSLTRRQCVSLRNEHNVGGGQVDNLKIAVSDSAGLTPYECAHDLRKGLLTITAKQRETIELACFHGLSLSEIAERQHDSIGNVRHHYYRGIKKLREYILERPQIREASRPSTVRTSNV
jgi:RNA polymerase sigma-70 factor, ECF subfamily